MRKLFFSLLVVVAVTSGAQSAERYFVVFFGSQAPGAPARLSHTFATFMKLDVASGQAPKPSDVNAAEAITISWLPVDGNIQILQRPVAGRNYSLRESFAFAAARGMSTTARGPFEIPRDVYDRAVQRKMWLESGAVAYKAVDRRFRPDVAINCIHAVSDILPRGLLDTGTARGDEATDMVANYYRPVLIQPERPQMWALRFLEPNRAVAQATQTVSNEEPEFTFTLLPPANQQ